MHYSIFVFLPTPRRVNLKQRKNPCLHYSIFVFLPLKQSKNPSLQPAPSPDKGRCPEGRRGLCTPKGNWGEDHSLHYSIFVFLPLKQRKNPSLRPLPHLTRGGARRAEGFVHGQRVSHVRGKT